MSEHDFWKGYTVYDAYSKPEHLSEKFSTFGQVKYFSFVAPSGGMFIWVSAYARVLSATFLLISIQLKIYFDSHPEFRKKSAETLEMQLWEELAKAGVLVAPGWFFSADQENIPDGKYEGHCRISFSTATVRICLCWKP